MNISLLAKDPTLAMSEINECVVLQQAVGWGSESVASHIFRADSINRIDPSIDLGYVLIARDTQVRGFARVTVTRDSKVHWLHEIVVDPSVQGQNLGFQIMSEAKKESISRGAQALFFTYDPMEAQNGNLYLTKCKATMTKVYENLYGSLKGEAHANRPTHRALIEWWFDQVPSVVSDLNEVPQVRELEDHHKEFIKIEIPHKVQALNAVEASSWSQRVYKTLSKGINHLGYRGIYLEVNQGKNESFLVLRKS